MDLFNYSIKDKKGSIVKGVIEAESEEALIEHFHKEGCIIFSVAKSRKKVKTQGKSTVKTNDLVIFSRQLTTLLESGISLVESLGILEGQIENNYFRQVIAGVLKDVKEGASFSGGLAKYKNVFPEIYISMVEAAEISGNLPDILGRVTVYMEKSEALKSKVKSALYYPVIIMILALAITGFLMFKVIPTFKEIFAALGGSLPLPTQILISISDMLTKKETIILIIAVLAGVIIGGGRYINTSKGKRNYHRLLLQLPIFGVLIRKIAIAKFSRTFATLIKSGVSIVKCLEIVAKTSGNKVVEEAVIEAKASIQEGQMISGPLARTKVFPSMVVKMIAIGEKSGKLEEMLLKIAQFYEEQTDAMVAGLASLIEPAVIVFLGVIVGGIVVSLFLPIIKITQYIGGAH